jgi:hypothetical protein
VLDLIPPRPPGFPGSRETFPSNTGGTFDPSGPAGSAVALTLDALLEPSRAARMNMLHARQPDQPAFDELLDDLLQASWLASRQNGPDAAIQRGTNNQVLQRLMLLCNNPAADHNVQAAALDSISELDRWLLVRIDKENDTSWRAHYAHARFQIERMREDPASLEQIVPVQAPPGSPIGTMQD